MTTEIKNHNGAVWVLAEQKNASLQAVSLQLTGKARLLADQLEVPMEVVLFGDNLEASAKTLIAAGADTVYLAESAELAGYQPVIYADIFVNLARTKQPDIVLMGSTCMGRELAPILAARLETGLTAHCINLVLGENNILNQQIPAYGGLISILCPARKPQMSTVAGGVFPTPELNQSRSGTIKRLEVNIAQDPRVRVVEIVKEERYEQSLDAAEFIVAGGAGTGDLEGWNTLKELSRVLNAGLGCTRPVVDEGWAELETMIGQSGKMVSPKFYLGAGLSGELQHMVGIKGAQLMIAINNDPKSPVFEQVDYGVVEDCSTFIPLLLEKLKESGLRHTSS
ncbi:electron transfer flavoprotein subunit alpha/FixB family protein [Desulfopila aestuarii]|uniref:Electron transfer flavoprotein alpha subunit apoprotein n=1 Tax=Desulfopila aestuarii DSM 18488 TaxID=1121416 RepID=A0A1M7YG53_9BACT|nr:electron transfer flavoprotein subunit alpha/FixB family protein [Desulfopila aestuarii]SHO51549.1 electron transfer flavoprotein alpha subunit apoprotein [Desulfopila aestuarii DSM 18488]